MDLIVSKKKFYDLNDFFHTPKLTLLPSNRSIFVSTILFTRLIYKSTPDNQSLLVFLILKDLYTLYYIVD